MIRFQIGSIAVTCDQADEAVSLLATIEKLARVPKRQATPRVRRDRGRPQSGEVKARRDALLAAMNGREVVGCDMQGLDIYVGTQRNTTWNDLKELATQGVIRRGPSGGWIRAEPSV